MAQPGWYPDSSGRMGHYRFWNGNAWSDVTTTTPPTPPPPHPPPSPAPPTPPTPAPPPWPAAWVAPPPAHARPTHLPQAHAAGWSRWSPHSSPRWSWPSSGR